MHLLNLVKKIPKVATATPQQLPAQSINLIEVALVSKLLLLLIAKKIPKVVIVTTPLAVPVVI